MCVLLIDLCLLLYMIIHMPLGGGVGVREWRRPFVNLSGNLSVGEVITPLRG
jgi:hypothetical protein